MHPTPFRECERGERELVVVRAKQGRSIHDHESLGWASAIFILCVADALLTLGHIGRGGHELNPFMANLIAVGPAFFVSVKLVLSLAALTALAAFLPRYRCARALFGSLGVIYGAVIGWHLTNFL